MPRTRKPKALSSATDTQEASPAPRSTAKPTTRKRKAPEKAPVIIADSPAAKSQFRVKRVKKVNPAPATEAQAKAPETSEAGRADGPVRENYAITPAQSMKRTTAAVAPAASGSTKPTKSTKSTKSRNGKQSTATTPKKHFPAPSSERRPRNWLHEPPKAFLDRAKRAKTEKLFVVNHHLDQVGNVPVVSFDMVGTTGNLYKASIGKVPRCDCPDSIFRRGASHCKHIIYVLVNVLKAPEELQFQVSFLPSELSGILAASPLHKIDLASPASLEDVDNTRKPVEGDCPICFMEFELNEEVTWCKTGCGNNVHKLCFDKWISTNQTSGSAIRCVYCRAPWQLDDPSFHFQNLRATGQMTGRGYVNVAKQFGLSPSRAKKPPGLSA